MITHSEAAKMAVERNRPRGGFREGSGRKPRQQAKQRDLFNLAVDSKWKELLEKLGEYIRAGDKEMIKYILDQRIGKAAQSIDHTSGGEALGVIILPQK